MAWWKCCETLTGRLKAKVNFKHFYLYILSFLIFWDLNPFVLPPQTTLKSNPFSKLPLLPKPSKMTKEILKPSNTYSGSCHCGANTYTVPISPPLEDPETTVLNCNCSICAKNGSLLVFVPAASINWIKGVFPPLLSYLLSPPTPLFSSPSSLPPISPPPLPPSTAFPPTILTPTQVVPHT